VQTVALVHNDTFAEREFACDRHVWKHGCTLMEMTLPINLCTAVFRSDINTTATFDRLDRRAEPIGHRAHP
ncbi:MAG: hypothetical protein ACREDR_19600, partial [Blastocatellia bacterium]